MKNLQQYQIIELIKDRMEYIADMKGLTKTSIYRLTGFAEDSTIYGIIRTATQLTSEKSLNKFNNGQYIRAFQMLGNVVEEMED